MSFIAAERGRQNNTWTTLRCTASRPSAHVREQDPSQALAGIRSDDPTIGPLRTGQPTDPRVRMQTSTRWRQTRHPGFRGGRSRSCRDDRDTWAARSVSTVGSAGRTSSTEATGRRTSPRERHDSTKRGPYRHRQQRTRVVPSRGRFSSHRQTTGREADTNDLPGGASPAAGIPAGLLVRTEHALRREVVSYA